MEKSKHPGLKQIIVTSTLVTIILILTLFSSIFYTQTNRLKSENEKLKQIQDCKYHNSIIQNLESENHNLQQKTNDDNEIKTTIKEKITAFLETYYTTNPEIKEIEKRKTIEQYVDVKTYQNLYPYPISDEPYDEGIDYSTSIDINQIYIDFSDAKANIFVMSEYTTTVFENTTKSNHIFQCTLEQTDNKWIITDIQIQYFIKLL